MAGCTLEDCLKRYFVAEHIENYYCSNCWHKAAIEYVSIFKDKTDIERLGSCNRGESCQCRTLSSLESLPWSNRFSRTLKQLSIAWSPQGHVSFPSVLDLSSFTNTGVGIKAMEASSSFRPSSQRVMAFPRFMYQTTPLDPGTSIAVENDLHLEASDTSSPDSRSCADGNAEATPPPTRPARSPVYCLVSVVEHFGSSGGGHYTVYRKVRGKIGDVGDGSALLETGTQQWFCISDSHVDSVLEREVMDANASMLFYEKLENF